jgi:hypothetical protein
VFVVDGERVRFLIRTPVTGLELHRRTKFRTPGAESLLRATSEIRFFAATMPKPHVGLALARF